jgi:hypothetical protein
VLDSKTGVTDTFRFLAHLYAAHSRLRTTAPHLRPRRASACARVPFRAERQNPGALARTQLRCRGALPALARRILDVLCCMLHVECCTLHAVCCMLHVVWCTLYGARCTLHAVCCMLHAARCLLHAGTRPKLSACFTGLRRPRRT